MNFQGQGRACKEGHRTYLIRLCIQIEYRLTVCPELCLGLFVRKGKSSPESVIRQGITPVYSPSETSSRDELIAHTISTKSISPVVTDEDMAVPSAWKINPTATYDVGHRPEGRTITLHSLAVAPHFQKSGYGKTLMAYYIEHMMQTAQAERISILTYDRLVSYYEKLGFTHYGKSQSELTYSILRDQRREDIPNDLEVFSLYVQISPWQLDQASSLWRRSIEARLSAAEAITADSVFIYDGEHFRSCQNSQNVQPKAYHYRISFIAQFHGRTPDNLTGEVADICYPCIIKKWETMDRCQTFLHTGSSLDVGCNVISMVTPRNLFISQAIGQTYMSLRLLVATIQPTSGHGSSFPSSSHWARRYVNFTFVGSSCQYLPQIDIVSKPRPYVCPEHLAASVTAGTMETTCWVNSQKLKHLWLNTLMAGLLIYLSFILLYLFARVSVWPPLQLELACTPEYRTLALVTGGMFSTIPRPKSLTTYVRNTSQNLILSWQRLTQVISRALQHEAVLSAIPVQANRRFLSLTNLAKTQQHSESLIWPIVSNREKGHASKLWGFASRLQSGYGVLTSVTQLDYLKSALSQRCGVVAQTHSMANCSVFPVYGGDRSRQKHDPAAVPSLLGNVLLARSRIQLIQDQNGMCRTF
ncbi:acetyltransferase [Colletotrichum lupini]|uniref:Acetyltransferase n=1 Tax=Colletotrichum lupini TaxID=145971 RepID=A0A9Q8WL27_9PEZI|nr:acetyltransferase [Colletotrichum lupini]UQC87563.1 acetyltransferase [Colletotrichum lupini]